MAHLSTIVKVKADTKDEAIERVKNLLTNDGEYNHPAPFDWFDEEGVKISEDCKTQADFEALKAEELKEHHYAMEQANKLKIGDDMKGYYLTKAGECLQDDIFWSTERLAYELDWEEGKNTYFVETDRHY